MLHKSEIAFLSSQGLSDADVFDGRGLSSSEWKAGVRAAGLTLVLGTPCAKEGHRLRTRSGHCAQCDPKKIAYQNRYYSPGFVYIAGSQVGKVIKIGTAKDIEHRLRNLNNHRYGGMCDWEVLFFASVQNGGKIEHEALSILKNHKIIFLYEKDGAEQEASEILKTTFTQALKAVAKAMGKEVSHQPWMSSETKKYEFRELTV